MSNLLEVENRFRLKADTLHQNQVETEIRKYLITAIN